MIYVERRGGKKRRGNKKMRQKREIEREREIRSSIFFLSTVNTNGSNLDWENLS